MLVVEEDSPKARLDSWGQAVAAEVHSGQPVWFRSFVPCNGDSGTNFLDGIFPFHNGKFWHWQSYRDVRVFAFQRLESKQWNRRQDLQGSNEANGRSWVVAAVVLVVVEEDSPKARLNSWGQAVAEVHSDDRRSSHDDDERLDHQVVDQWVGSGGKGRLLGGLAVEHPPPRLLLEGPQHDHQHFRRSRAMWPTEEFPARVFSKKNPVFLFESSFFIGGSILIMTTTEECLLVCFRFLVILPSSFSLTQQSLARALVSCRRFASSSGDRGVRGLGTMVLDSEIDWELVEMLEVDAFVP